MLKRAILILFFLSFSWIALQAQNLQKQIDKSRNNMKKIKDEIAQYENRLTSQAQKEKTEIENLNDINEKIGLLHQLLGELEQGRRLTEERIAELRSILSQTRTELQNLKGLTSQRLLQTYKHRDEDPLAYILTSDSWTQAFARMKYLKLIAEQDQRDIQSLRTKKEKIETQKKLIEVELLNQQFLISEKKREKANLDQQLARRKNTLSKIRKDKRLLASLIEQRKDDMANLQTIIAALEKKKAEEEALAKKRAEEAAAAAKSGKTKTAGSVKYKEPVYTEKSNFAQYKGRLPYPVPGKIVVSFGNQYNAALGTTTRNTGVDIQSREGAEVHSVAKGKVSLISWLRRLGNTVIIDHGEGFYTVYAHLSEIFVSVDQHVAAGQTIANLDESDEGKAVLHFEIYKDREAVDPAGWLR
ncbi:MAG TPA: peptidoglycan DD-metalloendopeptidase family protein, partial [bacterium]|nr:peptidoglycan DD-metalloendopeptidase family protein [bacterium]